MLTAKIFNLQKFSIHDGAGIRTDVFFQGCNLRCGWCSNPESQPMDPMPGEKVAEYTVDELVSELLKDKPFYDESCGGVTLTGGEALLCPEFVLALIKALHSQGVHVAIETAACIPEETFARVLAAADFAYIDLKHYDEQKHLDGTGAGLGLILRNIASALRGSTPVAIRIPVIPGYNDGEADIAGFVGLLASLGVKDVQLLPFHQFGESKYRSLNLTYAYDGVGQLRDSDVSAFAAALESAGFCVQIGG
jgi:pyruvate formate lyase activating enzyme